MIYLLDVNALIALAFVHHEFHLRLASWVQAERSLALATCSITELGFVRVLAQAPAYGLTVGEAQVLLLKLKKVGAPRFTFITDAQDIGHLPLWVKTAKQITDGHLFQLAKLNGAVLATMDEGIPGALLIPHLRGH